MQYVYKIKNILNKKFYIGRTSRLSERWNAHRNMLRSNTHHCKYLQNSWNKNGEENFEFIIFKVFNTMNDDDDLYLAIKLEQHFLDSFTIGEDIYNTSHNAITGALKGEQHPFYQKKPQEWMSEDGYQRILDFYERRRGETGESNPFYGKHHTEETKAILREKCANFGESNGFYGKHHSEETLAILSSKASQRTGEKNSFFGKTHSDETKQKISEANKGKRLGVKFNDDHKQKLRENSPKNKKIIIDGIIYISLTDAERKLNINRKKLAKWAKSDDPKYENYQLIN